MKNQQISSALPNFSLSFLSSSMWLQPHWRPNARLFLDYNTIISHDLNPLNWELWRHALTAQAVNCHLLYYSHKITRDNKKTSTQSEIKRYQVVIGNVDLSPSCLSPIWIPTGDRWGRGNWSRVCEFVFNFCCTPLRLYIVVYNISFCCCCWCRLVAGSGKNVCLILSYDSYGPAHAIL